MGHCCHPAFIQTSVLSNNEHLRTSRDFFKLAQSVRHNYIVYLKFPNSLLFCSNITLMQHTDAAIHEGFII